MTDYCKGKVRSATWFNNTHPEPMHSPNPIDVGPSRDKETREPIRITGGYNLGSILELSLPMNSDVRKSAKDAMGSMEGQSPLSSANTASTLSMPLSMSSRPIV
jgi:hypothetical protein